MPYKSIFESLFPFPRTYLFKGAKKVFEAFSYPNPNLIRRRKGSSQRRRDISQARLGNGVGTRPLLSSMDDMYSSYALSQKMAFEKTFPFILEAAKLFTVNSTYCLSSSPHVDEYGKVPYLRKSTIPIPVEVLRVVDLGAADGGNSHVLIKELLKLRQGLPLVYSLVDMPSNNWKVTADLLFADPVLGMKDKYDKNKDEKHEKDENRDRGEHPHTYSGWVGDIDAIIKADKGGKYHIQNDTDKSGVITIIPPPLLESTNDNDYNTTNIGDASTYTEILSTDIGTGAHFASASAHALALNYALLNGASTVVSLVGIPLHEKLCLPKGTVHIAISGTTMHWLQAPDNLGSTGSVFPGYTDHLDEQQREEWSRIAAKQWVRLLQLRADELCSGGWFIMNVPVSAESGKLRGKHACMSVLVHDMNNILSDWVKDGHIKQCTSDAIVVPVWSRTEEELRAPFSSSSGDSDSDGDGAGIDDLILEHLEVFEIDNPYYLRLQSALPSTHPSSEPDPFEFAKEYVRSAMSWGRPILLAAFSRENERIVGGEVHKAAHAQALLDRFILALESRVAAKTHINPNTYRNDYLQALIVCRRR